VRFHREPEPRSWGSRGSVSTRSGSSVFSGYRLVLILWIGAAAFELVHEFPLASRPETGG
jgi:hypothetical protein